MAHMLVGDGDQVVARAVEEIMEVEGHAVTRARSTADVLGVLRGSLHPIIAVLFFEGVTADDLPHLLDTAWIERDRWEPHAYILCAWWSVPQGSLLERRIADLAIPVLHGLDVQRLMKLVDVADQRICRRR